MRGLVGLKTEVSHQMLYRAVEDAWENMKSILSAARSFVLGKYDLPHTVVSIDSSTEEFSVEGRGRWLDSSEVRNELGIKREISHRMLNRAVERVGESMPEALSRLRRSLLSLYDLPHTDVNIDTTSVAVYSEETELYDFGYSRDKRPI